MQYWAMSTRTWELHPPMELRSVDPGRNSFQRYHLTVQTALFDAEDLLIEWVRLGQVPRDRVVRFTDGGGGSSGVVMASLCGSPPPAYWKNLTRGRQLASGMWLRCGPRTRT